LEQNKKLSSILLYAIEGVGAVFVVIFLSAYLGGMLMNPSTTVLHSELAFKIPLIISGAAFLVLVLAIVAVAKSTKK
jgi:hypothetical protein